MSSYLPLNLLETSFQLVRLPRYAVNRGKRLVKESEALLERSGPRALAERCQRRLGRAPGKSRPGRSVGMARRAGLGLQTLGPNIGRQALSAGACAVVLFVPFLETPGEAGVLDRSLIRCSNNNFPDRSSAASTESSRRRSRKAARCTSISFNCDGISGRDNGNVPCFSKIALATWLVPKSSSSDAASTSPTSRSAVAILIRFAA